MKFETYDFTIADHYASAIIYGDYSGLEDNEAEELDQWLEAQNLGQGHWDIEDCNDAGFTRDEVSGLMAMCFTFHYHEAIA
jgi:hypothetical protein